MCQTNQSAMDSKNARERTLRRIAMWAVLPAFPMLIAAGVVGIKRVDHWTNWGYSGNHEQGKLAPFFAMIPLGLTLITGVVFLQPYRKIEASAWRLIDLLIGFVYLAVLLPIWIHEPKRLNVHADFMMLETYGTCFLILNMFIHWFIVLQTFTFRSFFGVLFSAFQPRECPKCGAEMIHDGPSISTKTKKVGKGPAYSLLGDPAPYSDDVDEDAQETGVTAGPSDRPSVDV